MKYKNLVNATTLARETMINHVQEGSITLDCTVGNGNDTKLLAELVGPLGKVYGFDIQSQAIHITRDLLLEFGLLDRVELIVDSHEKIDDHIMKDLDTIVYNLGYLPKGDKSIKTNSISTVNSLRKALNRLNPNGLLLVTAYIGHDGGLEEQTELEKLLIDLDQRQYSVLKHEFINQKNNPPILYVVEKAK